MMTKIAVFLLLVSIVMAGGFMYYSKNQHVTENKMVSVITPTLTQLPSPLPTTATSKSELKIAIPEGVKAEVIDTQGRMTGSTVDGVQNAIPYSESKPDGMLGTVTWILLTPPTEISYTLRTTGISDKAIALYVKNQSGFEGLELIETRSNDAQQAYEYTITLNQAGPQRIIAVEAR